MEGLLEWHIYNVVAEETEITRTCRRNAAVRTFSRTFNRIPAFHGKGNKARMWYEPFNNVESEIMNWLATQKLPLAMGYLLNHNKNNL